MIGVMVLTGCVVNFGKWGATIIDASENIVTKKYELAAFDEVAMHCVGNVELIQSDSISGTVELTAPDNYIELYRFESKSGRLDINFQKDNINIHTENVMIKVYTADLRNVKNSGAASMSMDMLSTDRLEVSNSGVGTFSLQQLQAGNVKVKCSGVGNITISGQCSNVDLSCSGVGSINAQELKAQNAKAKVSGVGGISCFASEHLDGKVSGVGNLKYAGHPKSIDKRESGVGKIEAI